MFLFDLIQGTEVQLTFNDVSDWSVAWAPDGSLAFNSFREKRYDIYVVDVVSEGAGDLAVPLTTDDAFDSDATWSPDGSQIAFSSARGEGVQQDIYLMDLAAGSVSFLVDGGLPTTARRGLLPGTASPSSRATIKETRCGWSTWMATGSNFSPTGRTTSTRSSLLIVGRSPSHDALTTSGSRCSQ